MAAQLKTSQAHTCGSWLWSFSVGPIKVVFSPPCTGSLTFGGKTPFLRGARYLVDEPFPFGLQHVTIPPLTSTCWFSAGNEGMTPANHPIWFPSRVIPNTLGHSLPASQAFALRRLRPRSVGWKRSAWRR